MAKRQLRTIAKSMHSLHKKASEAYKNSRELSGKAEEEFWELICRLSEKYNCKIVIGENDYIPSFVRSYNYIYQTDKWGKRTQFNEDFEGELEFLFAGNLTLKQINEIKNLTGAFHFDEWEEPNGFYSMYYFYFEFSDYWNEDYQG